MEEKKDPRNKFYLEHDDVSKERGFFHNPPQNNPIRKHPH
jgi:hypothetical protein